jgi:UDP-N-acetyl-D-glucosamine/UDP-N-acetyl-D-galactosamine dehydrogenase
MINFKDIKLAILGLGYVGLPLSIEFGKKINTIGFDVDETRISELISGFDRTVEVLDENLGGSEMLAFTSDPGDLMGANVFIATVPTPVDKDRRPDLSNLISASEIIGQAIAPGGIVIYESTVYPGATEDVCVPVIEQVSGLKFNVDFYVGYSPERINPGDVCHSLTSIKKITSGSTPMTAEFVDKLYLSIISAGTHKARTIKIAEAAKVIENIQRDVNIGLINELTIVFNKLGIDTEEVLKAAETKWNFLPFRPGLVGGHCIGVDPYYLTYKAQSIGYSPEMILCGRRINDNMSYYIVGVLVKEMLRKRIHFYGSRILIMGLAFKENCADIRNTKVIDIVKEINEYGGDVDIFDPWVDQVEANKIYGVNMVSKLKPLEYDGIILAVAHDQFRSLGCEAIRGYGKPVHVLYDLKYILSKNDSDIRL